MIAMTLDLGGLPEALVMIGAMVLVVCAGGAVMDWLFPIEEDEDPWQYAGYPDGMDGEPTDDEIYNGYGREGGIAYDPDDSPGSLGEHDWRL